MTFSRFGMRDPDSLGSPRYTYVRGSLKPVEAFSEVDTSIEQDVARREAVARATMKLAAFGAVTQEWTVRTPANWREHLRDSIWQRWVWVRRWMRPARMTTHFREVKTFKAVCPHLARDADRDGCVNFVTTKLSQEPRCLSVLRSLLRETIKQRGETVEIAAEQLGVGRPALSAFLNGRSHVRANLALRIERVYEIEAREIMTAQAVESLESAASAAHR